MPNLQSFRSEAYKNGRRYCFEARFDECLWTATIRDESGMRRGVISCESHHPDLYGEELEDAVCDWVHRAVENNVGFSEEQFLPEPGPPGPWVVTSALQVELERARTVRAELALTVTKFTEAYASYRKQCADTAHHRGSPGFKAAAAGARVSVPGGVCAAPPHRPVSMKSPDRV